MVTPCDAYLLTSMCIEYKWAYQFLMTPGEGYKLTSGHTSF